MKSKLSLIVIAATALFAGGCTSEEKVDTRVEDAVMRQSDARRQRDAAERGNVNKNRDASPTRPQ